MATLQQALTRIDAICPNAWDDAAKIQWLNECEHMIQMRILDAAPEQCVTYNADTERGTVLLVPAPFDRLYVYYVIAMCDYAATRPRTTPTAWRCSTPHSMNTQSGTSARTALPSRRRDRATRSP